MKEFVKDCISDSVIIEDFEHGKDSYKCIAMLKDKLITIPFVEEKSTIIVKTVFWSQSPDIKKYKLMKDNNKEVIR